MAGAFLSLYFRVPLLCLTTSLGCVRHAVLVDSIPTCAYLPATAILTEAVMGSERVRSGSLDFSRYIGSVSSRSTLDPTGYRVSIERANVGMSRVRVGTNNPTEQAGFGLSNIRPGPSELTGNVK